MKHDHNHDRPCVGLRRDRRFLGRPGRVVLYSQHSTSAGQEWPARTAPL